MCRRWRIGCTSCRWHARSETRPRRPSAARRLPAAGAAAAAHVGGQPHRSSIRPAARRRDDRRDSRIATSSVKEGRSGALVFVTVRHEISDAGGVAVTEEHDIVYRGNPQPGADAGRGAAAPTGEAWSREIAPDAVLLFRYSALTFNGHRIHYDRRYVTEVEGYPGLVVHGPLIATLLLDLLRRERAAGDA